MSYKFQQQQLDFDSVIAPLEVRASRALKDPGLTLCRRAFAEDAERFRLLAADALERGRNPLALLVRMVSDGDHRAPTPQSAGRRPTLLVDRDGTVSRETFDDEAACARRAEELTSELGAHNVTRLVEAA